VQGVFLFHCRFRLSWKVDECIKPLLAGLGLM